LPIAPVINQIALNAAGKEICATTPTDIIWVHSAPLEISDVARGQNPMGISCQREQGAWLIAKDRELTGCRSGASGKMAIASPGFRLSEAVAGQGTRTAISATSDGRIATYCGKRIQFFSGHPAAASGLSVIANGGDGIFREIFWDQPGRLLGVVFELPTGSLRLETWATDASFPPVCSALVTTNLECQRIVPANDGRHCIVRGGRLGLGLFDPAFCQLRALDTSGTARQNAPLVCTADGSLLAMVADRDIVRLLAMPAGNLYAELHTPRQTDLTSLTWNATGSHLASITQDGCVQVWDLNPWRVWLKQHGLQ